MVKKLLIFVINNSRNNIKAAVTAAFVLLFISTNTIYAQIVGTEPNNLCDLQEIIANVIIAAVPLAGVVLFAMLVFGGFRYLSSGGDPKGSQEARNTITYAIAGIALLAGAWLILNFIKIFTGVNVTEFVIPCPN